MNECLIGETHNSLALKQQLILTTFQGNTLTVGPVGVEIGKLSRCLPVLVSAEIYGNFSEDQADTVSETAIAWSRVLSLFSILFSVPGLSPNL